MSSASAGPASVAALMNSLLSEPGRPRLTWYGDNGERIELSGAVLVNWVSKTTNLLVEEFDAAPGCRVLIDLPPHWRAAVWALASWRTGATVLLGPPAHSEPGAGPTVVAGAGTRTADADVVVTTTPDAFADGTAHALVAVALPALARRFDGHLPPGAIDAAGAVMTYADQILWAPDPDPAQVAVVAPTSEGGVQRVPHGSLFTWEPSTWAFSTPLGPTPRPGARVLLDGRLPLVDLLAAMLRSWSAGGSVVLVSAPTAAALAADPARRDRLVAQEGVTA